MRASFFLFAALLTPLGCQRPNATPPAAQPAAAPLSFKPDFRLQWPGTPEEHSEIMSPEMGSMKNYHGIYTLKRGAGFVLFFVHVTEFPESFLKATSPRQLLQDQLMPTQSQEISRKAIEHGSKKYPGFAVVTQLKDDYGRHLVVMAGRRLYSISASSNQDDLMNGPEVKAFFDSFGVD